MSILGMCLSFEASTLSYIYPQTPSRTIPNRKMIAMQMADFKSAMFSFGMVINIQKKPPAGGFEACMLWVFVFTKKNVYCSVGVEEISSELVSLTGLSTVVLNIAYDFIAVFSLRFAVRRSNVFVMFPVESIVKR